MAKKDKVIAATKATKPKVSKPSTAKPKAAKGLKPEKVEKKKS